MNSDRSVGYLLIPLLKVLVVYLKSHCIGIILIHFEFSFLQYLEKRECEYDAKTLVNFYKVSFF